MSEPSAKRLFFTGLIGTSLLIIVSWQAYKYVTEVGLPGLFKATESTISNVHLKEQPIYQVKRKEQLLGIQVIRIISTQQPEEFLVLDRVPKNLVDSFYGKPIDLSWANTIANQFVKLREGGSQDSTSKISVDVQNVTTQKTRLLKRGNEKLPYWQVRVQFKLSNEQSPRYYSAGVIRKIGHPQDQGSESLVVGYAQTEAYQPELVADLMGHLEFTQN